MSKDLDSPTSPAWGALESGDPTAHMWERRGLVTSPLGPLPLDLEVLEGALVFCSCAGGAMTKMLLRSSRGSAWDSSVGGWVRRHWLGSNSSRSPGSVSGETFRGQSRKVRSAG